MKRHLAERGIIVCALMGVLGFVGGAAGAPDSQPSPSKPAPTASTSQVQAAAPVAQASSGSASSQEPAFTPAPTRTAPQPAGVQTAVRELLEMSQGGVSTTVLKAYIENSTMLRPPSSADLIALKDHGISDDIATAFIKRAAELEKSREATLAASSGGPANAGGRPGSQTGVSQFPGGLDPESYDFWWYNYAYPRTLASANATLLSTIAPYTPFGFGGYPVSPYGSYLYGGFGFSPFGFGSVRAPFGSFSPRGFPHGRFGGRHLGNHVGGGFHMHSGSRAFGF